MKSLTLFMQCLLVDTGRWCGISTARDYQTVASRVEHEGISFLTISLPRFGKDLEKGLSQGAVTDDLFSGFARTGGLPRFLGGFLRLVFDAGTGRLLDNPNTVAIWAIRQITLAFAKINLPCSDARTAAAVSGYIQTEREVRENDRNLDAESRASFIRISSLLWAPVLQAVDEDVYYERIIPRHGPGATADRLKGNLKWMQHVWTERLEREFPSGSHLFNHSLHFARDIARGESTLTWAEPGAEIPVRVITVPKTLEKPRIIAIEPTCMQYMQQGLLRSLVEAIRTDYLASFLIGFSSQVPNQELARKGSLEGDLATLDLSEASDRVSNQHVRDLLSRHPNLLAGVDACRSRKADVPGYGVQRLAKFASMGSALTFPFEAMVFATVIFMGIESDLSRRLTRKDVESYVGQVRVYGDDIIVPVRHAKSVVTALETFGFRVNVNKSFWTGKFRESCGKEYYGGDDVSIVRLRSVLPTDRRQVPEIVSTVSTRNQLYQAGLWSAARKLDSVLESLLRGRYPHVTERSPVLGRVSYLREFETHATDTMHRPLVRGYTYRSKLPESPLTDERALLKCLTLLEYREQSLFLQVLGDTGLPDRITSWKGSHLERVLTGLPAGDEHLELAGRPESFTLKLGFGSAV